MIFLVTYTPPHPPLPPVRPTLREVISLQLDLAPDEPQEDFRPSPELLASVEFREQLVKVLGWNVRPTQFDRLSIIPMGPRKDLLYHRNSETISEAQATLAHHLWVIGMVPPNPDDRLKITAEEFARLLGEHLLEVETHDDGTTTAWLSTTLTVDHMQFLQISPHTHNKIRAPKTDD